jgi:hypothetical protein
MARNVSNHFNTLGSKGEQRLMEDLIIESIRINGMKIYYVPRTFVKLDSLFGEDPLSKFEKVFPIEMYFDNPGEGFGGDRFMVSKFGFEMRETASFIVSRRRFNEAMRRDGFNAMPQTTATAQEVRPLEGDIIYLPLTNDHFEIKEVEHESVFYQVGYRNIFRLDVQKWDYSSETINTGVPEIDRVQEVFENLDSVANNPLADNNYVKDKVSQILDVTETNIFGDPTHF